MLLLYTYLDALPTGNVLFLLKYLQISSSGSHFLPKPTPETKSCGRWQAELVAKMGKICYDNAVHKDRRDPHDD